MKRFIAFIFITALFVSCNDEFLEKYPVTSLTEETAFESYDNFRSYAWQFYATFTNTNIGTSVNENGMSSVYDWDYWAGYFVHRTTENKYAYQTVTEATTGNGWTFTLIRKINIMLSHINDCDALTDAEKKHWKAVGYFFHSFWYMELINRFGDVPWVVDVMDDTSEEAYAGRDDRMIVADSVLARLQWAEENIGDFQDEDGDNTINRDCVRAALSRFTLREGTWRKYHGLSDYNKYFTECQRVSLLLMADYPTLYYGTDGQPAAGYGEMWTTEDLGNVDGVILYKQYLENYVMSYFCHSEHTKANPYALHQDMIDMYLCTDGQTISNSTLYNGDKDMYSTFRNRDPRLYHTIMPPYKVSSTAGDYPTWSFVTDTKYREYIDIMGVNSACSNPGVGMKRLPAQNWSASLLKAAPNINGVSGSTYMSSYSGYFVWKNYDCWEYNVSGTVTNTADKPVFKIEEVLLNYAEAMFELGLFDQGVADASINKLRDRAGVTYMTVSDIDADFDPNRDKGGSSYEGDYEVDPVLWEIRRERIIELMGEGFGFYDVRRWRKAHFFINRQPKGFWTKQSGAFYGLLNEETHLADYTMTEGYAYLKPDPINVMGAGWLEKYYLFQVPTNEIVLNPNLSQNPGW